jgi:hypothetical protein
VKKSTNKLLLEKLNLFYDKPGKLKIYNNWVEEGLYRGRYSWLEDNPQVRTESICPHLDTKAAPLAVSKFLHIDTILKTIRVIRDDNTIEVELNYAKKTVRGD